MSDRPSIKDVAEATGVAKSTVSCVLNGNAAKYRISGVTQAKILAMARQMDYHPNNAARNIALGNAGVPAPVSEVSQDAAKPTRQIGLVLSAASPASSLTLIPGLDPVFSAAGYRLTVITVPTDPAAARERLSSALADGIAGFLACPTVYPTVSESVGNTCPVIVLWQDAAKAILAKISGSVEVEAPRAQPPAPAVSRAPVTPPPVIKAPPITVVPPVVAPEVTPLPEPAPIPAAVEATPIPEPTIEEATAVIEEPTPVAETPVAETPVATTPVPDEAPQTAAEPPTDEVK